MMSSKEIKIMSNNSRIDVRTKEFESIKKEIKDEYMSKKKAKGFIYNKYVKKYDIDKTTFLRIIEEADNEYYLPHPPLKRNANRNPYSSYD